MSGGVPHLLKSPVVSSVNIGIYRYNKDYVDYGITNIMQLYV